LGIVGLVPLFVLLAALLGRRRLAIAAVAVAAPVYLIWALLLDAAVHRLERLTLIPSSVI